MPELIRDYCDRSKIEEFEETAAAFFQSVLGMPPDACMFISDESDLDDFAIAGLPDEAPEGVSWDQWVIAQIDKFYGISLATTRVNLVSLFSQIEQVSRAPRH